jgi:hypothetical protein
MADVLSRYQPGNCCCCALHLAVKEPEKLTSPKRLSRPKLKPNLQGLLPKPLPHVFVVSMHPYDAFKVHDWMAVVVVVVVVGPFETCSK